MILPFLFPQFSAISIGGSSFLLCRQHARQFFDQGGQIPADPGEIDHDTGQLMALIALCCVGGCISTYARTGAKSMSPAAKFTFRVPIRHLFPLRQRSLVRQEALFPQRLD